MMYMFRVIRYALTSASKYMNLIIRNNILNAEVLRQQTCLKKTEVQLELLVDFDMLLKVEKGIRDVICHAIHWNQHILGIGM